LHMLSVFLIILALPAALSTHRCWVDGELEGKMVIDEADCENAAEEWCLKSEWNDENNKHVIHKMCGNGFCKSESCHSVPDSTSPTMSPVNPFTCCCKGNLCNAAAGGTSLVHIAALTAAAAAVWQRP
ncbi:hypothetical protein PENTCL1PPCAC_14790, partial [Pristionchus entomophagus]